VAWDPYKFELAPFLSCGGIFMTGTCLEDKRKISLLNVYGPCTERKTFWDKVVSRGMLAYKNLIVAGDLNFTVRLERFGVTQRNWTRCRGFFKGIFQGNHLVNIILDEVVPTWWNGRIGREGISKILDRVLFVEGSHFHYRQT
jgi:hypothetical protein